MWSSDLGTKIDSHYVSCLALFTQALLAILTITAGQRSAPKIVTMTPPQAIVPRSGKAVGGTTDATTQTSMVCTSRVRSVTKECRGITGKIRSTLSRGPR